MRNAAFESDIADIPSVFTKLNIVEVDGEKYLKGELDIVDSSGKLWDTYAVEIKGTNGYPYSFPRLYETANAFPKILDWHVYENDDKSCCVDVSPNEKIICCGGLRVADYIKRMAIPYLANQTFRSREGYYLYGEYSHGIFGRIEFYQSKLRAVKPIDLIKMFEFILRGDHLERTANCPFCHGVKFRKCHRDVFKEFELIREYILNDWALLKPFFSANPNYKLPMAG